MQLDTRQLIERATFLALSYEQQVQQAQAWLASGHYGVLLTEPPGQAQQPTVNVDSPQALVAACVQLFAERAVAQLELAVFPHFVLSGILFSRHPGRPDVALAVMEGGERNGPRARLFFDEQGTVRWSFPEDNPLRAIAPEQVHQLQRFLRTLPQAPAAAEWIWDGEQLRVVQWFPITSLPAPQEAWSCRTLLGFSPQVITPLWYTCWGRWMKEGYWRRQTGAAFAGLERTEPYRRLNSHLYFNSQFARALGASQQPVVCEALPVAWHTVTPSLTPANKRSGSWLRWCLQRWYWQLARVKKMDPWQHLMQLDHLGYRLAQLSLQGLLAEPAEQVRALSRSEKKLLAGQPSLLQAPGFDPVWQRQLTQQADYAVELWRQPMLDALDELRALFGQRFAKALMDVSRQLVMRKQLSQAEDVHFCFFDELWELWFDSTRRLPEQKLHERKLHYMADAHAGPPDWLIDGKAYGASPFSDQQSQPLLLGDCLVKGEVSGPVRKIFSAWQLNLVEPGDIVVLHHAESGWLTELSRAAGFILAHRQPLDPLAAYAREYAVPSIWNITDALHSLVDGTQITLLAEQGRVLFPC